MSYLLFVSLGNEMSARGSFAGCVNLAEKRTLTLNIETTCDFIWHNSTNSRTAERVVTMQLPYPLCVTF